MTGWGDRVSQRNAAIAGAGRWRTIRALDGRGPLFTLDDGREVVSFASNDYLGLSQHPSVVHAAVDAIGRWGTGAGSSRLVVGDRPIHRQLEAALADWKDTEAALVFPTGYAANVGVLSALGTGDALILSDEHNHASIVDGCRLARAEVVVYPHADVEHVAKLLATTPGRPSIVVSDAVFSMDGDVAPLGGLARTCLEHGALLVVDEAHAVLPPTWSPQAGLDVLRVGTLSKTLGSVGGFVAGPRSLIDQIINTARSFIFTTAPTPADMAAALAALQVLRSDEGDALLGRLSRSVDRLAAGHPSPIVPIILGDEGRALDASTRLMEEHGLLVPAIRPPTVAPGTSRLRLALSAAHTNAQVERLVEALEALELARQ
ncbi:MAG TPA: 8-amino-7-oxononanoate synthase [Acidimicrobiales bacterium]|nr:8-amino-7-oxononanoate synthase [Acidimicrobiales bacterium]